MCQHDQVMMTARDDKRMIGVCLDCEAPVIREEVLRMAKVGEVFATKRHGIFQAEYIEMKDGQIAGGWRRCVRCPGCGENIPHEVATLDTAEDKDLQEIVESFHREGCQVVAR